MACCGKRKAARAASKARMSEAQQHLVEVQQVRTLQLLKNKEPSSLPPKLLLDYHRKTHMIHAGAMKRNPPNKQLINSAVDLHDKYVKELLKRGMKHNTPLKKI